ncbi:MAG: AAA family ATPase [Candidatus Bathyarchaeota archaeon]|nr:MAG: AAA family ATPase [Candidatus Bathyarchaeota archaeon]
MSGKVISGIPGLDELVDGGLPEGRVILVIGGPGTGKTILCGQFLHSGIYNGQENGVFVTLDESKEHFYSEMKQFGWDFQKAQDERKFALVDATRVSRVSMLKEKLYKEESRSLRGKQLPIDKLVEDLQAKISAVGAKRVAVDTLAALTFRFPDPIERRSAMTDLIESLSDLGVTSLVTTELGYLGLQRKALEEEFLVHGVIMMQTLFSGATTTRAIQVEKMRGAKVNPSLVPYSIDQNGIEIYPTMPLFGDK